MTMSLETSAHDTGLEGEDAASSRQSEVTNSGTAGDSGESGGSPPQGQGSELDGHQVPLKVLLEERARRQEAQRERDELARWRDEKSPMLNKLEEALPRVRDVYSRSQELESENSRLKGELDFLRSRASEQGLEFDEKEFEEKQFLRSLAQQMNSVPDLVRGELERFQIEQEAKNRQEREQREERDKLERGKMKFTEDFDKLTKDYPILKSQYSLYESIFESNRGGVSARELLDPILMTLNGAQGAVSAKGQVKSVTGQSTAGGGAGGTEDVTKARPQETLSDYFSRLRTAHANGEI